MIKKTLSAGFGFVVIALCGAVLSFGSWSLVSYLRVENTVLVPYNHAVLIYLVFTLGIPYIVPNLFGSKSRIHDLQQLVIVSNLVVLVFAVLSLCFVPIDPLLSQCFGYISLLCASILAGQISRCVNSFLLAILGALSGICITLPAVILSVSDLNQSITLVSSLVAFSYCMLQFKLDLIAVQLNMTIRSVSSTFRNIRKPFITTIKQGLYLIPHLTCFGVLLQGPRYLSEFGIDNRIQMHYIALLLNVAFTFIGAVHPVISVNFLKNNKRYQDVFGLLKNYSLLGLFAGIVMFVLLGTGAYHLLFPDLYTHTVLSNIIPVGLLPLVVCIYYFGSTLMLKTYKSGILSLISCVGFGFFSVAIILFRSGVHTLTGLTVYFLIFLVISVSSSGIGLRFWRNVRIPFE